MNFRSIPIAFLFSPLLLSGFIRQAQAAPVITSPSVVIAPSGTPFNYQITSNPMALSYGLSAIPAGLSFNSATGQLSGTPTTDGNYDLIINATDANGTGDSALQLIFTSAHTPPAYRMISGAPYPGTVGTPLSYQLSVLNGGTGYSAIGLPPGLTINTSGLVSGTPTTEGITDTIISATNGIQTLASTYRFQINPSIGARYPSAYYIRSPISGNIPLPVFFDAGGSSGDAAIVSYDWSFGDGTAAAGVTASHSYTVAGTIASLLTVTDSNGRKNSTMHLTRPMNVGPAQLNIASASALPGTPVDVAVSYVPSPDVNALSVGFDLTIPAGLQVVSFEAGPATLAIGHTVYGAVNNGVLRVGTMGFDQNIQGPGVVVIVRLQAVAGTPPGNLSLNMVNPGASDSDAFAIPTTAGNGVFMVQSIVTNQAPTVAISAPASVTLPTLATLSGSATDDGLPSPPGTLTYNWSKVSGPGTITFGSPSAATTTAEFSAAGSYVLRLTASDSVLSGSKDVTIVANTASVTNPRLLLGSGSTAPNSTLELPVTLQTGSTGIVGTQFELVLPAGFTFVSAREGAASTSAGKFVYGSAKSGGATVLIIGMDQTIISDGIVAYVTLSVGASAATGTHTIGMANLLSTDISANPVTTDSSNGTVTVLGGAANQAPTVAAPASASVNPVTGMTTTLNVLGADDGGEASLIYRWAVTGSPPADVNFNRSGTNASKSVTATFAQAGTYALQATIQDAAGLTATSTVIVTVNATASAISVSPPTASVPPSGIQMFTAQALDQFNVPLAVQPAWSWSVSGGGTINNTSGVFSAGVTPGGPFTVTVSGAGRTGAAQVSVANAAGTVPTVAIPASISPSPVAGKTATLSVLGADTAGEANLTYTWNLFGAPPAGVVFSPNGTNAAKNSVVTFSRAGSYFFLVTIQNATEGLTVSATNVVVGATPTSIVIAPAATPVQAGKTQTFTAQVFDQFSQTIASPPALTWSVSGGGTIHPTTGLFTAGSTAGGPYTVTATAGVKVGVATLTVTPAINTPPTLATPIGAAPNPVTGLTTDLAVLGADDGGEANLTYTWTTTDSLPVPVFNRNGTHAASTVTAIFSRAGIYNVQVTIQDAAGLSITDTRSVTVNATLTDFSVTPANVSLPTGDMQYFSVSATDQFNQPILPAPAVTWSISGGGTIDSASGLFTAGAATGGPFTVTASRGPLNRTSGVTIVARANTPPTLVMPAAASPNPALGLTTNLVTLGTDDGGEANLTYSWSTTGTPPAPVSFDSINGTHAASVLIATFARAGTYSLLVTIRDAGGLTVTSPVTVTVNATLSSLTLSPENTSVLVNTAQSYLIIQALDQFGRSITPTPTVTWSVSGGGTMNSATGVFTAGSTPGGPFTVTATAAGGKTGTTPVTVIVQNSGGTPSTLPVPDLSGIHHRTYTLDEEITFTYPVDGVEYQWAFATSPAGSLSAAPAFAFAPNGAATTRAPALALGGLGLDLGAYTLTIVVSQGNQSVSNTAQISLVADTLDAVKIYPNPWRNDRHAHLPVTFADLSEGTTIKIFSLSGQLVRELTATGSSAPWDLKNESGDTAASGIYLYLITDGRGLQRRGKLAVIR